MDGDNYNGNNDMNGKSSDQGDALGNSRLGKGSVVAHMWTDRNATCYKMDNEKRGLAIIFNHDIFKIPGLKSRSGTHVDCKNLEERLKKLHFEVSVYHDLDRLDILEKLDELSKFDHSKHDCFLLAVLSHGEMGILYAKDNSYKPDVLWNKFTADQVPTLAGKPKIFFIQACQGDQLDAGVTLSRTETDGVPISYRIPSHADFLIAYSTIPGFFSWRNTTKGSWFIQALCDELRENGFNYDLLTLLTFVSRRVALDYESNTPDIPHMHSQKQIPCIMSMLTRLVKFTKRN